MQTDNSKKPWRAFESVSVAGSVTAEWKARLGPGYEAVMAFLRPNGKLAASYPCTVCRGCGCAHDVVVHGPEDIVAVCHCERGCETLALERSDIVVYELDRAALDSAVAGVLGLFREADTTTDVRGTTRIGVYSPYAGFRFPVYLTVQTEPDDFDDVVDGLLARNEEPFILVAPTRDLCTVEAERRLTGRKALFVPLSENVGFGDSCQLRLIRPLDEILEQFRKANLPSPREDDSLTFFPTPPDATWGDVSIRFVDGYTVSVKVKAVTGVLNYTQMGMASRKNGNPTVQWGLLRTFAEGHGTLDWSSPGADRRNQKRRELLAANLRSFFRIESDPFRLTRNGKGWQTRFSIFPDE